MDSVTQALLGGATALVVTRGKSPRKAVLWGAAIATLPDLDVLIPHGNALDRIVSHRTWSHSWLVHSAVAPLLAAVLRRLEPTWSFTTCLLLVWVALITHSGLDACTVYGTDLFWPLAKSTVIGGNVFIIDPIYTLFLLMACGLALIRPLSDRVWIFSTLMLTVSSLYLVWGLIAQTSIHQQAADSLAQQGIQPEKVLVQATPFNTLLWRILAIEQDHYYEGFRSVLDREDKITFTKHPRNLRLLESLDNSHTTKQLKHFNHGYYALDQQNNQIIANDLRMGTEPFYVFQFLIAERDQNGTQLVVPEKLAGPDIPADFFQQMWRRIFNVDIQ